MGRSLASLGSELGFQPFSVHEPTPVAGWIALAWLALTGLDKNTGTERTAAATHAIHSFRTIIETPPGQRVSNAWCTNDHYCVQTFLIAGVTEGCEVEAGAGEEAAEQAGPVLHAPQPGLDQGGELGEIAFGQVGQGSFQV